MEITVKEKGNTVPSVVSCLLKRQQALVPELVSIDDVEF